MFVKKNKFNVQTIISLQVSGPVYLNTDNVGNGSQDFCQTLDSSNLVHRGAALGHTGNCNQCVWKLYGLVHPRAKVCGIRHPSADRLEVVST